MKDSTFKLLEDAKDELTIEDVLRLHEQGIVIHCEDGKIVGFDFEYCLAI